METTQKETRSDAKAMESDSPVGGVHMSPPAFNLHANPVQRMVDTVVQRQGADTPTLARLRQLLDDDKETESINLIGTLSEDEVRTFLSSSEFQSLAVSSYNNDEMYRAMKAAGVAAGGKFLLQRLQWMFEEGTEWAKLKDVISSGADSASLYANNAIRDKFVSELNDREMAELVGIMGGTLVQKLRWMKAEGSNWDLVRPMITPPSADAAQAVGLYAYDDMRAFFVDICSNETMKDAVKLMGGTLSQKLSWMKEEGCNWTQLKSTIEDTADLAQRVAIYPNNSLRALFVDVCNNETMAEAVSLLGGTLAQKFNWMAVEGSNWDAVRPMIGPGADAAQKLALYGNDFIRSFFVDICNNVQMAAAVDLLGGTLTQKLSWMKAEGCNWEQVKTKVRAVADPAERAALYGNHEMQALFVDVCGNDTMAEAVKLIGGTLNQKLSWMVAEGTNIDLVADIVRHAPAAELAGVTAEATLMAGLQGELSASGYQTFLQMVNNNQLWAGEVTGVTDIGTRHPADMRHTRSDIFISKKINFIEKGTFGPGGFATMKTKGFNSVTTYLDNKFKVKIEPQAGGSVSTIDGVYPIRVSGSDDSSGTDVKLTGGQHGRSNAGEFYELGQANEVTLPDITFGHEMAHVILGSPDEYADPEHPRRTVFTDNSLMGNFYGEGFAGAQIKARHFQYLIPYIQGYYPDRLITIVP